MDLTCRPPWLVVRFHRPQEILSWALTGGGRTRGSLVAWHQVRPDELSPGLDPRAFLYRRLEENGLPGATGLVTSHPIDRYVDVEKRGEEVTTRAIATVGLDNALRVGDPAGEGTPAGTINLLCAISCPLSEEAMLEALSLAAEARAAAALDAGVRSTRSGRPATGTGTDCIVIAAPAGYRGLDYAGKHTPVGSLVGASVYEAIETGIIQWKRERA